MINAVDIELPTLIAKAVKRGLDGDAVANLPAETLHRGGTDNCPLAILQKRAPLIVWNLEFRKNLALVLRIDNELREEILWILIYAAKPVIERNVLHAVNTQDLIAVRKQIGRAHV